MCTGAINVFYRNNIYLWNVYIFHTVPPNTVWGLWIPDFSLSSPPTRSFFFIFPFRKTVNMAYFTTTLLKINSKALISPFLSTNAYFFEMICNRKSLEQPTLSFIFFLYSAFETMIIIITWLWIIGLYRLLLEPRHSSCSYRWLINQIYPKQFESYRSKHMAKPRFWHLQWHGAMEKYPASLCLRW